MTESTIETGADLLTFINVFTVEPDRQQELVDLLVEATDSVIRDLPGFVSANIHRSADGRKVVNYAQWASPAEFQAMLQDPRAAPHLRRIADLAQFDPIICQVVHVRHS